MYRSKDRNQFIRGVLVLVSILICTHSACALIRFGNFLHVGSLVFRYMPSRLQTGGFREQTDGMLSFQFENYMTHMGYERLTMATSFQSMWNSDHEFNSPDVLAVKNDFYVKYNSYFSVGLTMDQVWSDDDGLASSGRKQGFQSGVSARFRW